MPSKPAKRRTSTPAAQLRRAKVKLGIAETRAKLSAIRDANRIRKEMLATYGAADRGRRNKDWRAPAVSADLAIIPDSPLLIARTRQMARDSWIIQSAIDAYCRNVVGPGIIPIPQAKDENGKLLPKLNRKAMLDFWAWAGDKQWCDIEGDQTFWQMEDLAERERVTAGEGFLIWSYVPNRLPNGKIDLSRPIGLKLQAFEAEQLNHGIISYLDPVTGEGREVRGGIEVDSVGKAVAYHVFAKNPADYGWSQNYQSKRIDAGRVLHYFKKTRVRQKRGVTPLASVLQDARDLSRQKEAHLWRAIMEACIGGTLKRDTTAGAMGGGLNGFLSRQPGDTGTTNSGMPTIDFVPGMIADPGVGVTLEPYIPQAPGNGYEPFQRLGIGGVAAGAGLGPGQVWRKYEANYSAARQEMLEDRKVFEPLQELLAHNLLFPLWRIFFALSVAEGRFDAPGFELDPMRYTAADYVAPPPTWIDPKAEADALEKLVELRVITREEIAHLRGTRLSDVLDKIAAERDEADSHGIEFAENQGDKGIEYKRAVVEAFIADRMTGPVMANQTDLKDLIEETGIKTNKDYEAPELPVGQPAPTPGSQPAPTDPTINQDMATLAAKADVAPNYRLAAADSPVNCAECKFFDAVTSRCSPLAYDFKAAPDHVCDSFETRVLNQTPSGRMTGAATVQDPDGWSIDDAGARGLLAAKASLMEPNPGEAKNAFIERFVRDAAMQKEFPDDKQRVAVAEKYWERSQKK